MPWLATDEKPGLFEEIELLYRETNQELCEENQDLNSCDEEQDQE